MKTNFNPNYNQNFGMALYMPKGKKISKALSKYFAVEAEIARPKLQKIAEDVDLYVNIHKSQDMELQGFDLLMRKSIKNPIKRFLSNPPYLDSRKVRRYRFNEQRISELLIEEAEKLKATFIAYSR